MKKALLALLACALLVPALCLADGPVLLVELPEDAQMVEDVQFDDGDFIQTYQLANGGTVQLLRYASFDMTLAELAEGEWSGYTQAQTFAPDGLEGSEGMRFTWQQEDEAVDVTMVRVPCEGQTLLFQAMYPQALGQEAIDAAVQAMLDSLSLLTDAPQEEPVVG